MSTYIPVLFIGQIQGWQLVIIIALVLLLFAAPKLPAMARNLGQSMRIFKSEVRQMKDDTGDDRDDDAQHRHDAAEPVEGRIVDRDRSTGTQQSGSRPADRQ